MRLNLGCGYHTPNGWVNVDREVACAADQIVDLEQFPWPWPDDSVSEVLLSHVLEHLGPTREIFYRVVAELYRISAPGASMRVIVPHPRHDNFINDPTHVRAITPDGMALLSKEFCEYRKSIDAANTLVALYLGVDFKMEKVGVELAEPWRSELEDGKLTRDEVGDAMRRFYNVVATYDMTFRVLKSGGAR